MCIFINNITAREGLYAFVFNKSFNTLVKKSLISDNSDLIYYHFHQFNLLENNRFDWCSDFYKKQGPPPRLIYETYEAAFKSQIEYLNYSFPEININKTSFVLHVTRRFIQKNAPGFVKKFIKAILSVFNLSIR